MKYATNFYHTENPLSEGSAWRNGAVVGLKWHNVITDGLHAHGTQDTEAYDDSTAILAGTWNATQSAQAVVSVTGDPGVGNFAEVELRLRSTLSANTNTGYEILFNVNTHSEYACQIMRWDAVNWDGSSQYWVGPLATGGATCVDGDVIKATVVGDTITAYINGVEVCHCHDSTYTSGAPGIGFFSKGYNNTTFGLSSFSAIDGTGTLRLAASTSSADVNTAISAATSGDVVLVKKGTATWSGVAISGKNLILQGAGVGQTVITGTANALVATCTATNKVRVTGFTFMPTGGSSTGMAKFTGAVAAANAFRCYHNRILNTSSSAGSGVQVSGIYGLIDHNAFDGTGAATSNQLVLHGTDGTDFPGYTPWLLPLSLGTANAVYIENNTFTAVSQADDIIDGYRSARAVIRYNTFTNITHGFHGTDSGSQRSPVSVEVYSNTYSNSGTSIRAHTMRGGTGVFYSNTYSGNWYGITLQFQRGYTSYWGGLCDGTDWRVGISGESGDYTALATNGPHGFCNVCRERHGTWGAACSASDGGTYSDYFDGPASDGYPGRDQPGVKPGQIVEPVYVWNNGAITAGAFGGEAWILSGRDFINNGSTPKPGYSAYTYPHPLQDQLAGEGMPPVGTPVLSVR